jgi:peptidoglycan/xylan/chitin deacetylase (PgdA/CDA1 family)
MTPWAQGFGSTFVGGSPTSKQIALTYDDGPNDPHTFKLLDACQDDVRAYIS